MNVNFHDRPDYFSFIIGLIAGILVSVISTPLLFSPRSDFIGNLGLILLFFAPPIFLGIFAYMLSIKDQNLWKEIKGRIVLIVLSLTGFSIGWYVVSIPTLISKGEVTGLLDILRFLVVSLILGPILAVFPILGPLALLITLILSYYITKDLETKQRVLITVLLIFLVFWPSGLVLEWLA